MGKPTQIDIARQLGISQVAVSKALRGHAGISDTVRRQVLHTADRLGYQPNMIARSLVSGKTSIVGYIAPSLKGEFFAGLLQSIQHTAARAGYRVLVTTHNDSLDVDDPEIDLFMHSHVDGIVSFPKAAVPWDQSAYATLQQRNTPVVFLNHDVPLKGAVSVYSDDRTGAREAVTHFIEHGHRAIGIVLPDSPLNGAVMRRHGGYLDAMHAAALTVNPDWTCLRREHTLDAVERFLSQHPELTAVLCFNDKTAFEVYTILQRHGRSVPEDMSVIGFGAELDCNHLLRTPLTSVSQGSAEIGRTATELLLRLLKGDDVIRRSIIPVRLVPGRSVAAPRSGPLILG